MTNIDPKIIEKIQKLINLKEGAEAIGSMHEAENAATRLQEFLFKYNLDLDTVKKSKIEAKAEMDNASFNVSDKQDKRESNWIPELYVAVAKNLLCEVRVSGTYIRVIGHKHNVSLVLYIAEQLVAKVRIAEKGAWGKYDKEPDYPYKEKRGTFRRGFLKGCGEGINRKLEQQKREMSKEHNPFALMIVNKELEVKEYLYELYPYLKPDTEEQIALRRQRENNRRLALTDKERDKEDKERHKAMKDWLKRKGPRQTRSEAGYEQGYKAGQNMEINKGID